MIFTKKLSNYFLEEKDSISVKKTISFVMCTLTVCMINLIFIRNNKDLVRYISVAFIGPS